MSRSPVLSDAAWARIEPLLPDRSPQRGGRWTDHREVIEAICWRFRTGAPWRDLPEEFPHWKTVWHRFDVWSKNGIWDQVLTHLQGEAHAVGDLEWTVSVDSTVARAHQHAAGARRQAESVEGPDGARSTGGSIELQGSGPRTR